MNSKKELKEILTDYDTCRAILKVFHPDLEVLSDAQMNKLVSKGNYHWYQIMGKVKDYGMIHICIDDCHDPTMLFGPKVKMSDFNRAHSTLSFHTWQIVNDVQFRTYSNEVKKDKSDMCAQILLNANYRVKTPKEWHDNYYSD